MTRVGKFKEWAENHPLISPLIILGLIMGALSSVIGGVQVIHGAFPNSAARAAQLQEEQARAEAERDANEARDFAEAQGNLRWIFGDEGASRIYAQARARGSSRYQSALAAQSGKTQRNSYRTIVEYGEERVERFLERRESR